MGRLRYGETLISKELRRGISVFPPLPPTKTFSGKTRKRSKPTLSTTKRNVPSSPVDEDETDLVSKLNHFQNMKFRKNKLSFRTMQEAESVRKALIEELTMSMDNVESMVDKASDAFVSLSLFGADFGDLYDAVRVFISYQCQLSKAKKELESNECLQEDMAVRRDTLLARSSQEAKALRGTRIATARARKDVDMLVTRIGKTRKLLKKLEKELAKKGMKIDGLQKEGHELEERYEATMAEQQNIAKQIEEEEKIAQQISTRCDKARAGIERTKTQLCSLC